MVCNLAHKVDGCDFVVENAATHGVTIVQLKRKIAHIYKFNKPELKYLTDCQILTESVVRGPYLLTHVITKETKREE